MQRHEWLVYVDKNVTERKWHNVGANFKGDFSVHKCMIFHVVNH